MDPIPIIDLFAGPGGLGEGFMSLKNDDGKSVFDIKLSIEKDVNAHKTLTLRSFYRQFDKENKAIPEDYYNTIRQKDLNKREQLIEELLNKYPEGEIARKEARLVELGSKLWPPKLVDSIIKEQLGENKNWVLIGGPPCQAYSLVGRSRVGGISENDHRVYLYKEYLRVISKFEPAVFVMENVKGLLSAKVNQKSVFQMILDDLKKPYKVFKDKQGAEYYIHSFVKSEIESPSDFLIKSEEYGIPQKRHRVILLGIRTDIKSKPSILKKFNELVSIESVIEDLPEIRSKLNRKFDSYEIVRKDGVEKKKRKYKQVADSNTNWEKIAYKHLNQLSGLNGFSNLTSNFKFHKLTTGSEFIQTSPTTVFKNSLANWYRDERMPGIINHESRGHLVEDLKRYLFATLYSLEYKTSPKLKDYKKYSKKLMPDHESADSGKFADRFRVQIKGVPATTITSHISKDGHYFIHYDIAQCRSLTVREAARIQTFPDNYLFRGSRTAQYQQVGNAVPPYLAFQISKLIFQILD